MNGACHVKQVGERFRVAKASINIDNLGSALTELVADREQSAHASEVRCGLLIFR